MAGTVKPVTLCSTKTVKRASNENAANAVSADPADPSQFWSAYSVLGVFSRARAPAISNPIQQL